MNWLKHSVVGVFSTIVFSLLISIMFAYFFRFPTPLAGYIGPFGDISIDKKDAIELSRRVFIAWLFYGVFGGFVVLSLCGMLTGIIVGNIYSESKANKYKMIIAYSAMVSIIPVFVLSILDYLIGTW